MHGTTGPLWGFHRWLGLADSADFFTTSRHLVQTKSLLRYPVFVNEDDYRGKPDVTKHSTLRRYLLENFVVEVEELKGAVVVALGPQVQAVLDYLIHERVLRTDRLRRYASPIRTKHLPNQVSHW